MMKHNRQLLIIMFTATLLWSAEPVGRNINVDIDHQARVMAAAPVEHVVWDGNQISTIHGNHGAVSYTHLTLPTKA